jgi:glyoxylase-like metal-dependent hydrolase (beta-lactamase superfamily II)
MEKVMRKISIVVVVMSLLALSARGQQPQPDWSKVQIEIKKLTANVYMLRFSNGTPANVSGNVGAFVGDEGTVIVDDGYAPVAPKLEAALKTISDKPVKYVFNTHWHGDHSAGNEYFGKFAVVIGHDNVWKMKEKGGKLFAPTPVSDRPSITFSDRLTLHINGADIQAIHFPHGHTDTDSVIFFPQGEVVQMGDDFTVWNPPHFPAIDMDRDESGGVQGQIAAAEYVLSHAPGDVQIIPGHGPLAKRDDLVKYLAVLKGTAAAVQAGIDQGKSLDQLEQEKILAQWDYLGSGKAADDYLERVYRGLTQKPAGAGPTGAP